MINEELIRAIVFFISISVRFVRIRPAIPIISSPPPIHPNYWLFWFPIFPVPARPSNAGFTGDPADRRAPGIRRLCCMSRQRQHRCWGNDRHCKCSGENRPAHFCDFSHDRTPLQIVLNCWSVDSWNGKQSIGIIPEAPSKALFCYPSSPLISSVMQVRVHHFNLLIICSHYFILT